MSFILGIDAGGTRTMALLCTPDGRAVAEGSGGPGNFQAVGEDAARAAIEAAIRYVANQPHVLAEIIDMEVRAAGLRPN